MRFSKLLDPKFYVFNQKKYKQLLRDDICFNATFRNGTKELSKSERKQIEFKIVKTYRKYQTNIGNLWGYLYREKLKKLSLATGVDFMDNPNFGRGLIIGHWGKIVINGYANFGDQIMITHGVTIGRDIRGKREGVPTFGNRVCIRTNSTITGNIVIGDDVLIAPNTFVNFDVPSHSIVIGNPATIHHKDDATLGHLGWIDNE